MHRILPALLLALAAFAAAPAGGIAGEADAAAGTAYIRLEGSLPIRASGFLFDAPEQTLHVAALRLREALNGPEATVAIDLAQGFAAGPAACEELAALIRDRPEGKRVVCCVDDLGDASLILAAACDEIVIAGAGLAMVDGVAMDAWYAAGLLAKLGITAHAVTSGPYKTAPELFTREGPSEAGKQELAELAQGIDDALVRLSARPQLDAAGLAAVRARAPQTPDLAVQGRLADRAEDPAAWKRSLPQPVRELGERPDAPDLSNLAGLMSFWGKLLSGEGRERPPRCVAVVELAGEIMPGPASEPGETICDGDTVELLDELADDDRVVAVVLRIDSPGGDAGASDRIHRAVRRVDARKPVLALFDQVAASGGYYIGCAAREIHVHRTTITGSIGVFALIPDISGTTAMIGLNRHVVATAPRADLFGPSPWTDDKAAALRQVIEDVDRRFQGLVAAQRKLPAETVAGLAGGRVYTGDQAIALKLADGVSHLLATVRRARELAGHQEPLPVDRLPKAHGLAARLGLAGSRAARAGLPAALIPGRLRAWADLLAQPAPRIVARAGAVGGIR